MTNDDIAPDFDTPSSGWDRVAIIFDARRGELGLSVQEVANRSQLSRATVSEVLNGVPRRRPARTMARLSKAVQWPPDTMQVVYDGGLPPIDPLAPSLEAEIRAAALLRGEAAAEQHEDPWPIVVERRLDRIESEIRRLGALVAAVVAGEAAEG